MWMMLQSCSSAPSLERSQTTKCATTNLLEMAPSVLETVSLFFPSEVLSSPASTPQNTHPAVPALVPSVGSGSHHSSSFLGAFVRRRLGRFTGCAGRPTIRPTPFWGVTQVFGQESTRSKASSIPRGLCWNHVVLT